MKKIVFIVGPTGTGKTSLALQLIKAIPSDIISADSRQVYIGMDIGTGKDIPKDYIKKSFNNIPYLENKNTKIWMIDQVLPNTEWSVSQFVSTGNKVLDKLYSENKLPIVVGGTGLYSRSLIYPPKTLLFSRNTEIRSKLEALSKEKLQEKLLQLNPQKMQTMNNSDRNNPRRLVRAIEVIMQQKKNHSSQSTPTSTNSSPNEETRYKALWIGLSASLDIIEKNIEQRVHERLKQGMEREVKNLIEQYPNWNFPAFTSTGYREIRDYLEKKISLAEALHSWKLHEFQYAKRQLTWFKKQKHIQWFDIKQPRLQHDIENYVKTWYYSN